MAFVDEVKGDLRKLPLETSHLNGHDDICFNDSGAWCAGFLHRNLNCSQDAGGTYQTPFVAVYARHRTNQVTGPYQKT